MYTYIYVYTYTYLYTHTYIYIYTYEYADPARSGGRGAAGGPHSFSCHAVSCNLRCQPHTLEPRAQTPATTLFRPFSGGATLLCRGVLSLTLDP